MFDTQDIKYQDYEPRVIKLNRPVRKGTHKRRVYNPYGNNHNKMEDVPITCGCHCHKGYCCLCEKEERESNLSSIQLD